MNVFRFSISFLGVLYDVDPLQVNDLKLKSEQEGENIFFRSKLGGSLKFIKQDFQRLLSFELSETRCTEVFLDIEKLCGGEYQPFYKGVFSLNEANWNLSKCEVTVPIRPNDAYKKIMDLYSKAYNVLELPATDAISAKLDFDQEFEFFNGGLGGNIDDIDFADTWLPFLKMNYWVDGNLFNKGYRNDTVIYFRMVTSRNFQAGVPVELDGWITINDDQATQRSYYAKAPDIYNFKPYVYNSKADFNKYPDLLQIDCGAAYPDTDWITAAQCISIKEKVNQTREKSIIWKFGFFNFNRNRRLLDVISFLLRKFAPEAAPAGSDFFTLPVNYATGLPNQVRDLLIAQKSDIISPNSSEAATKGMLSLKSLLDDLRNMFQVYWFLDASGQFRLEHISYFETVGTVDFTQMPYAPFLAGKLAYEYETSKMPRFERLTFTDFGGEDFEKGEVEYISSCVNYQEGQDLKELTVSGITTDIGNLIVSGNGGSREGFVLLTHDGAGNALKEIGDITGQEQINGHLAAANLLTHYWKHNRILISGLMSGKQTQFNSILKTKRQVAFGVPVCCDLEVNPFFSYITNLSNNGKLLSSEINFKSQIMTIQIVHDTSGSGTADLLRQFDDSFDESFN